MEAKLKHNIREWLEAILSALVIAFLIRAFVVQPFKIPTGSMRMTLMEGDRILVNKFIYRFQPVHRGDVIVFKYPEDPKRDFVKRLIALPGETVQITRGRVVVNGHPILDPPIGQLYYYNRGNFEQERITVAVPPDHYFALGDNSQSSRDSRYWGFVPKKHLVGRAFVVYWPPHRIRVIH